MKEGNLKPRSDEDRSESLKHLYRYQTILNLYNSGIPTHVIASQLDIDEESVHKIIQSNSDDCNGVLSPSSSVPLLENSFTENSTLSIDTIVNTDIAIKNSQIRMWKALQSEPEIFLSLERTNGILRTFSKSKVTLVILHIDLVDSTELSVSLPLERLSTILQTFMQEIGSVITAYGGYVLKYIGDAVLGFFLVPITYTVKKNGAKRFDDSGNNQRDKLKNLYLPCINAINCGGSILKIIDQAINPILNQYDYPEISVRIGIDVGENVVIQDGWDIHELQYIIGQEKDEDIRIKEPHFDILGYSTNIAVKMTSLARANGIVIGQSVYENLDHEKYSFRILDVNQEVWKYIDNRTDTIYRIYRSI